MLAIFTIILICITFAVLTLPGELLAPYARKVYLSQLPQPVKKLITCPYCVCFWVSTVYVFYTKQFELTPLIFVAFLVVYFVSKNLK